MTETVIVEQLRRGLNARAVADADRLAERLADYLALLERWNRSYNLTAVRDPVAMVSRHIFDSLAIDDWVSGPRIADVGTGAGLPGIPLALLRPADHFTLIDAAGKRTRFVRHAVARLGLENVDVVQARVEEYDPGPGFDTVISRAFAAVAEFVAGAGHLRGAGGGLLAMKGAFPADELADLPSGWHVRMAGRVSVTGLDAARHAVLLAGPEMDARA